jgi:hypothetical protein
MRAKQLCPEADFRASLSDADFWNYVLLGVRPGEEPDWDGQGSYDEPEPLDIVLNPCGVCGEWGPCDYDAEGRPLIHWQPPDEDDVE